MQLLKNMDSRLKTALFYIAEIIVILLIIQFVARLTIVNGFSMENTLGDGDVLVVWQWRYHPQQGDMVLVDKRNPTDKYLTKRVVAVQGQHVLINADGLHIDGTLQSEPYVKETPWESEPLELTVPPGQVFAMGDNRSNSLDCRDFGCIQASLVKGKLVFRLFPFGGFGIL